MSLKELGEFGLIEKIKSGFSVPAGITGIGDDCSVLPQKTGFDTIVSADMLIEGKHFILSDISPRDLGWKSAAVNFSDIAACGGRAIGSFLSLGLPPQLDEEWIDGFIAGYRELSLEAGAPLLGGDTTSADKLCINVTVIGETLSGQAKMRSTARPGDLICVTGSLGDSAAGLKLILKNLPRNHELIRKHYRPVPRLREGQALASIEDVHAMMDISDGIGSDIRHILKASDVGACVDISTLPLSEDLKGTCDKYGWDPVELALCGGEDYELLFTVAPEGASKINIPYFVIGKITTDKELVWNGAKSDYMGFRHF